MDDDEPETAVTPEMRSPTKRSDAARTRHTLTHPPFQPCCEQCVRGRAPDRPHRRMVGGVREEIVIESEGEPSIIELVTGEAAGDTDDLEGVQRQSGTSKAST